MSREAEKKQYKATVETPCDDHGPHGVTITGDGPQVWGAAMATMRVIEKNGGVVTMHFYINGDEVDWRQTMDGIEIGLIVADILEGSARKVNLEDLPF